MDEIIKLILFPEHSARKSHGRIVLRSLSWSGQRAGGCRHTGNESHVDAARHNVAAG
jgi:hypothetical protein